MLTTSPTCFPTASSIGRRIITLIRNHSSNPYYKEQHELIAGAIHAEYCNQVLPGYALDINNTLARADILSKRLRRRDHRVLRRILPVNYNLPSDLLSELSSVASTRLRRIHLHFPLLGTPRSEVAVRSLTSESVRMSPHLRLRFHPGRGELYPTGPHLDRTSLVANVTPMPLRSSQPFPGPTLITNENLSFNRGTYHEVSSSHRILVASNTLLATLVADL